MAMRVGTAATRRLAWSRNQTVLPRWPSPAWGAIGITASFVALTCWWLTQDRSIPVFDAGLHLAFAIQVDRELSGGSIGAALTSTYPYPPLAYLVGSLGIAVAGIGVAPLVIAENLVFVPLLALGCYKVGRLAFGPLAGMLAVVFALGSPLISAQFRVFMVDAPETAMVAISVWLVLATEGLSRLRLCAAAGLALGLAAMTKEPAPVFVLGVVAVTVIRGGRRSWRGFAVFAATTLAIALPWYIDELHGVVALGTEATSSAALYRSYYIPDVAPPRFSIENLSWYFWNIANAQLFIPLMAFSVVGWLWTIYGLVRRRPAGRYALELVVGAFVAWLTITETFIHDTRYSMPLLIYLAVFGAGWIGRLRIRPRLCAAVALGAIAIANTLGVAFAVGQPLHLVFPGADANTPQLPGTLTLFENLGSWSHNHAVTVTS